ncbi:MAG TPA: ATP-binding protein [Bryobacteraceae bacterium]|jgi:signal transduction histidine kinase|nr:ATP-binding protein [Bryobacteraceae bacterium]
MIARFSRLSLLWKILLSTSVAVTLLFALTGWIVLRNAVQTTTSTMEDELGASFQAYQSLWEARATLLASVSLTLAQMSDVRSAFGTRDPATIRDTANELWNKLDIKKKAAFLVADAAGNVIASVGGMPVAEQDVRTAAARFPDQVSGLLLRGGHLYQTVFTPVYLENVPQNVLVAGYAVDGLVARQLKAGTGGSEFLFVSGGQPIASSLAPDAARLVASRLPAHPSLEPISAGGIEYAARPTPLLDIAGKPIGDLWILRSFQSAQERLAALRRNIIGLWLLAVAATLGLTYLLARRIVEPLKELDRAAAEVGRQNYEHRVKVVSQDELGRLAQTFNAMCASIQQARQELIRQERISTIGRLSSSIVHDLRNPLAAVYGGSEMLVDTDLAPSQVKRLAANIYRASRRIQELLQDLLNVSRGSAGGAELCNLREVAVAGCESLLASADAQHVEVHIGIPDEIELPLERNRMERVFSNLVGNALEMMPEGGRVQISAAAQNGFVVAEVRDTGPGIAPEIRGTLFEPFVSAGKKNGLGLGLALARQTVLDHGGDMWAESEIGRGACFRLRLPDRGAQ